MLTLVALCSVLAAEGFVADVAAPRAPRASAALRAASAEAADVAPSLSARVSAIEPSKTLSARGTFEMKVDPSIKDENVRNMIEAFRGSNINAI